MPKSKEDYQDIQEQRKAMLLESALRLFALYGYDSISIDDITKGAKCSHGLFYHYFKSKEDLFYGMMASIKDSWENSADVISFEQKPKFAMREIIDFHLSRLNRDDSSAYTVFFFLTSFFQKKLPEIPQSQKSKKGRLFAKVLELIKKGQEEGDFEKGEPKEYALVLFSCLRGLAYARIHLGKKGFTAPRPEILMNLFVKKGLTHA